MSRKATPIQLAPRQRQVLDSLSRSRTRCHQLVIRAKVMLMADEGWRNADIGQRMALERHCVGKWRARWDAEARCLATAEQEATDKQLAALIEQVLADAPRSGAPAKFMAEQIVRIIALACENPVESARPVTHWTRAELADEAVRRGIVESISPRQVGRFLKYSRTQTPPQPLLAQ